MPAAAGFARSELPQLMLNVSVAAEVHPMNLESTTLLVVEEAVGIPREPRWR
jgi:hypothetical protein